MTVVDFLLARPEEELQLAGCSHEITGTGALRCLCEGPSSETLEAVAKADLSRKWSSDPRRGRLLGLLADEYATHPDYSTEWHRIS